MKKKLLSLLVAVCLFIPCLFMLSACGNNVVGKYTVSEITMGDTTWSKAEFEEKKDSEDLSLTEKMFVEMCSAFFDMSLELKEDGALCNVAPTVLQLMGIEQPKEMDCESLIK